MEELQKKDTEATTAGEAHSCLRTPSDEIYKWALESIAAIVLETKLGFLEGEMDSESLLMIEMVQKILQGNKALDSGLRLWERFPSKEFDEFYLNYKMFTKTAYKYITDASNRPPTSCKKSLISDLALTGCDQKTISVMAADLMFGGVDTTSHSSIFALYLLATNQEKQDKLAQEISSTSCFSSELLSMSYLRAVMKESLRMMQAALGNIRQLNQSMVLNPINTEHTYHLDPGTNYILAHQTMARSEIHPFVTLPFGVGKRMCIGTNLSEMEMSSLNVETVRKFKVGWTGAKLKIKLDTLIFPDGELHFILTPR